MPVLVSPVPEPEPLPEPEPAAGAGAAGAGGRRDRQVDDQPVRLRRLRRSGRPSRGVARGADAPCSPSQAASRRPERRCLARF
jgi:hypothetical protein